jgi:hypothetical protein
MSNPEPYDPTTETSPTPLEVNQPTANPGRSRSFHRTKTLARFPLHAAPTCLSGTTPEGWVLLGFPDGKVGAWHPSSGAYLLRPFHYWTDAEVVGLAWGTFPVACALFADTSVLIWNAISGEIRGFKNDNSIAEESHARAVKDASERYDPDYGWTSLRDESIAESDPTRYTMSPAILGSPDGFIYCLIEPFTDSYGTHVLDIPRLERWDGSTGATESLGTPTDDCSDVSLRLGAENTILVMIDGELIQVGLKDGRNNWIDSHHWSYARLIEASSGPPGSDLIRVATGSGVYEVRLGEPSGSRCLLEMPDVANAVFFVHGDYVLLRTFSGMWHFAVLDGSPVIANAVVMPRVGKVVAASFQDPVDFFAVHEDGSIRWLELGPLYHERQDEEIPF